MLQKRQGDLMRMNAIFIYINTQNFGKITVSKKIIYFSSWIDIKILD
jgi:hypothetical protein